MVTKLQLLCMTTLIRTSLSVCFQAAGSIDDLRAIPWIFAWTQTRLHLPVWLGIGGAFKVPWQPHLQFSWRIVWGSLSPQPGCSIVGWLG